MSADPNPEAVEILDKIGELYLNEDYSDVVFVVDGENLPAHQAILSQRSPVFKAMFPPTSDFQKKVIELPGTTVETFELFLKFVYTGTIDVEKDLDMDCICTVFDVMTLAKTYEFPRLVECCVNRIKYLCATVDTVELINEAIEDSREELVEVIVENVSVIDVEFFDNDDFTKLHVKALRRVLEKTTSAVPDNYVFYAVVEWMEDNPLESEHFPDLLELMNLKSMEIDEIIDTIRPLNLVDADVLLDFVSEHAKAKKADGNAFGGNFNVGVSTGKHPTYSKNPYIATIGHNARNAETSDGNALICNSISHVPEETSKTFVSPTKHVIMDHVISNDNQCIMVDLEQLFTINTLEMKLADGDWSYWIEVSEDNVNWTRIIDYSKYICRSVQRLYFKAHSFRYIRIHGIAPVGGIFKITHFGTYYDEKPLEVDPETNIVIPTHNVASAKNNAIVIQGLNWADQYARLLGHTSDNNFTFNHVGKDPIIVQLPQPYILDSMKFKLNAVYLHNYDIEVSTDKINWTQVYSGKYVKAWQYAKFAKQPIVFIKLIGIRVMQSNAFCCKHFECSAVSAANSW
uniref:BTB domain-containing protein n=1 Tax=Panagrellus redivivus TaxID=6233 RepID=A0A7E4VK39_PANRE